MAGTYVVKNETEGRISVDAYRVTNAGIIKSITEHKLNADAEEQMFWQIYNKMKIVLISHASLQPGEEFAIAKESNDFFFTVVDTQQRRALIRPSSNIKGARITEGTFDDNMKMHCWRCRKVNVRLRCSSCRFASYCGEGCQKKHWSTHKKHCHTLP